jgi:hypothetical protein
MEPAELIRRAIHEKNLIEFQLQGLRRIAEPHLLGLYKGARQLLFYQVQGESRSGDLPAWRRADLAEMSGLRLLEEGFEGPRLPSERHTQWDTVLARVE